MVLKSRRSKLSTHVDLILANEVHDFARNSRRRVVDTGRVWNGRTGIILLEYDFRMEALYKSSESMTRSVRKSIADTVCL